MASIQFFRSWLCVVIDPSSLFDAHILHPMSRITQAIRTCRNELKRTQKDLAAKNNELLSVIQGYESGAALPDKKIIEKLQRVSQVKLRGPYPP
jgi:ribosome-binding protein aMBF1 (putative translation factor)